MKRRSDQALLHAIDERLEGGKQLAAEERFFQLNIVTHQKRAISNSIALTILSANYNKLIDPAHCFLFLT